MLNDECEICGGAGFIHPMVDGVIQFDRVIACECTRAELAQKRQSFLLQSCRFPEKSSHMTFENYRRNQNFTKGYEAAINMANHPNIPTWLGFLGMNDTGKTHLGIAICRKWVESGVAARYVLTSLLLDELREGFRVNEGEGYTKKFNYYCTVPLLMLDDLGIESKTGWVQEKLETIIDYRLMHNLSLIITSNLEVKELPDRIRSRMLRNGDFYEMGNQEYALTKYGRQGMSRR